MFSTRCCNVSIEFQFEDQIIRDKIPSNKGKLPLGSRGRLLVLGGSPFNRAAGPQMI